MQLYNVLTRRVESFKPTGNKITIYVCGITPYDTTHLGHCFTYTSFDVLIRYLEFLGNQVRYVQNVTDIDDDILRKAREVGEDWRSLGNRWTRHFVDDNQSLNLRPPDYFPRATDVIPEIIDAVEALINVGVAYESAGNVYFRVAADPDYGKLSGLDLEEMLPIANERGNNPSDPHKSDPLDFVLWQAQSPGEPAWNSPWGPGRPGWHIECSTMSAKYLGQPVDIHGGGADLIFPHHESEIAQAEFATNQLPFTRHWMHIAMVRYQGEKMSKSLGNLIMVRDLLQSGCPVDAIRLCMVAHHYRQPWSYEESDLEQGKYLAGKFMEAISVSGGEGQLLDAGPAEAAFQAAMDDDLNTPAALQILTQLADDIIAGAGQVLKIREAQEALRTRCRLFGLMLDRQLPDENVTVGWESHRRRFSDSV